MARVWGIFGRVHDPDRGLDVTFSRLPRNTLWKPEQREGGCQREGGRAPDFADVYPDQLVSVWRYVRSRVPDHHEAQDVR